MVRAFARLCLFAVAGAAGAVSAAAQTPEIAVRGVFFQGKDTYVALAVEKPRESEWVKVGGTFRDIVLVAYDVKRDVATLRRSGQLFEASLFSSVQGTVAATAQQAHEVEKGQLVGDLLEIGMEHRRRLREAAAAALPRPPE
jgi:hypothetical protein